MDDAELDDLVTRTRAAYDRWQQSYSGRGRWSSTTGEWEPDETPIEQARREEWLALYHQLAPIAHERGMALLHAILTDEQIAQMEHERQFQIVGSEGGTYLIRCDTVTRNIRGLVFDPDAYHDVNVYAPADRGSRSYCVGPFYERVAAPDVLVCQVLMLLNDERGFLDLAY